MAEFDEHARPPGSPPLDVDGVRVDPPTTEQQARNLLGAGLLAGDVAGLAEVWRHVRAMWDEAVTRPGITPEIAKIRVAGEWSLTETLRHLVSVTDGWIGIAVLGIPNHHPWGLLPDFARGLETGLGLDVDADPSLAEVLPVRASRFDLFEHALAQVGDDLDRPTHAPMHGWTARGAFQVVIGEEAAHHAFATRDLAALGL